MFNLISNEKEKMKVINYYHFSTALQMCAVIGTVAAPLTLYSVELGLDPDRIGILGSLMAFCQVLALISIPLTLYFGSKILSSARLTSNIYEFDDNDESIISLMVCNSRVMSNNPFLKLFLENISAKLSAITTSMP